MAPLTESDIFLAEKLSERTVLKKLRQLLKHPHKVIEELHTLPRYHDEPRFYQFAAKPVDDQSGPSSGSLVGVGTSLNRRHAEIKALAEAAERSRLARIPEPCRLAAADDLRRTIELKELPELMSRRALNKAERLPMFWLRGFQLDSKKLRPVQVPAHLITVPYRSKNGEPIIRQPISTGAALGTDYATSILSGLMEVIERDAFMLSYYQSHVNHEVLPRGVKLLEPYLTELSRCRLSLRVFDISTDAGGYVFLSLLLDDTGVGPHLTAGMKAGFNAVRVAQDSIAEAVQLRTWLRDLMLSTRVSQRIATKEIVTLQDRAIFWLDQSLRAELDFYLKCRKQVELLNYPKAAHQTPVNLLERQITKLSDLDIKLYFVDLTDRILFDAGFRVTKTIATKLQPMHLDERTGFPIGPRFSEVNLKSTPHFFL